MDKNLLVLTYNVGNGRADPDKLGSVVRRNEVDIVGLQELSDSQASAIQRTLGADYPHRALFPGGFAGKGIVSRYPILKATQVHLGPERPDLVVTLEVDGFELTVISAHPPPPRFRKTSVGFDPQTIKQIEALAALAVERNPAILLGDFNFVQNSNEYRLIKSKGLLDAFHESGRRKYGPTLPKRIGPWRRLQWLNKLMTWIPLVPIARVDYIWYTEPIRSLASWVGEDAGSDHLPVLARLEFVI
jgi:endonuclease/exonuclease/phosphatase family metal-dependent hydrolase